MICTVLYIMTSAVLVGIVPYQSLDNPAPIAVAVNRIGLPWFAILVKIGAIAGPVVSDAGAALWPDPHLLHHVQGRAAPRNSPVVHPKFQDAVDQHHHRRRSRRAVRRVPVAGRPGGPFQRRAHLAAFALVCVTVIYLRYKNPDLVRPFRTPLFPVVPILGALMCLHPVDEPDGRGSPRATSS